MEHTSGGVGWQVKSETDLVQEPETQPGGDTHKPVHKTAWASGKEASLEKSKWSLGQVVIEVAEASGLTQSQEEFSNWANKEPTGGWFVFAWY